MRIAILCLLVFSWFQSYSQGSGLAIINSADGYINVREGQSTDSKILSRIYENQVFFCDVFDDTGRWVDIVYSPEVNGLTDKQKKLYADFIHQDSGSREKECSLEGFVCKSEFTLLDSLPHIETGLPDSSNVSDIVLHNDSLKMELQESVFDRAKHKMHLEDTVFKYINNEKRVDYTIGYNIIDDKYAYGILDEIPQWQLTSLKLTIKGIKVAIPDSAYDDMYDFRPHLSYCRVVFAKNGTIYLTMSAGDGAVAYFVAWIIKDGKYIGRYIDRTLD